MNLGHVTVEEGQQERADVGTVDIGIRHDDDLVVADLGDVEILGDAGAQCYDQHGDLIRRQHLVDAGALDIENLASQGKHSLVGAVASLLGGTSCRIAFDDEEFRLARILFLAVGELARQIADMSSADFLRVSSRARRAASRAAAASMHLETMLRASARVLLEPLPEPVVHDLLDHRPHLGGHQLVLGLGRELGIGHLAREHGGEPFAHVLAGDRDPVAFEEAVGRCIGLDRACQRAAESGQMGAAVTLGNVVREAKRVLVVGVRPLHLRPRP